MRGLTMIELVVVIVLMGILSLVVAPMISVSFQSHQDISESHDASEQATQLFTYLRPLFLDASLQVAETRRLQWVTGGQTYLIEAELQSGAYRVVQTVSGTTTLLMSGLSGSGGLASFEMTFFNRLGETTQVLSDIVKIEFSIGILGRDRVYTFHKSLFVQEQVIELIQ